jgi:CheY-like chemotaxis protein
MLQNLVSNAIKYAPGGKVLVGVRRRGASVVIAVIDQGPGIMRDDHDPIFREFVRLEKHRGGRIEGIGLGLSIAKRLSELMAVRIALRSQPGRGSEFRIEGFVTVPPRVDPATQVPRSHQRKLEGLRVLIVDDNESARESTVRILARWGCSVRATANPAIEPETVRDIDFILCDQDLGLDRSGLEIIHGLRAVGRLDIPAAITTGSDTTVLRDQTAAGGITVLSKPARPAQLRSLLLAAVAGQSQSRPSSAAMPAAAARVGTSRARNTAET